MPYRTMRIWIGVLLVACGGSKPATVATTAPPPKCAYVADHLISLMSDTAKSAPTESIDQVRRTLEQHCNQDGWRGELQDCLMNTAKLDDIQRCDRLMTEAQKRAFEPSAQGGPTGGAASVPASTSPAPAPAGPGAPPVRSNDPEGGE